MQKVDVYDGTFFYFLHYFRYKRTDRHANADNNGFFLKIAKNIIQNKVDCSNRQKIFKLMFYTYLEDRPCCHVSNSHETRDVDDVRDALSLNLSYYCDLIHNSAV